MKKRNLHNNKKGQTMILMVLLIGTLVISIASFLGLLSIYKLKQATNSAKSAQAVFIADTGREWELMRTLKNELLPCPADLPNGSGFTTFVSISEAPGNNTMEIISQGKSFDAVRAWKWNWGIGTSSIPSYANSPVGTVCGI